LRKFFRFISLMLMFVSVGYLDQTITDPQTKPEIEKVKAEPRMITTLYRADTMDRGNHDYYDTLIVIDPAYYKENNVSRGDVVFFEENGHEIVLRVIALPVEKINVNRGQIYINGKSLDAFYGKAHRLGKDVAELKQLLKKGLEEDQMKKNVENVIDSFENANMDEIHIDVLVGTFYQ
jgi:signal peptidase I